MSHPGDSETMQYGNHLQPGHPSPPSPLIKLLGFFCRIFATIYRITIIQTKKSQIIPNWVWKLQEGTVGIQTYIPKVIGSTYHILTSYEGLEHQASRTEKNSSCGYVCGRGHSRSTQGGRGLRGLSWLILSQSILGLGQWFNARTRWWCDDDVLHRPFVP